MPKKKSHRKSKKKQRKGCCRTLFCCGCCTSSEKQVEKSEIFLLKSVYGKAEVAPRSKDNEFSILYQKQRGENALHSDEYINIESEKKEQQVETALTDNEISNNKMDSERQRKDEIVKALLFKYLESKQNALVQMAQGNPNFQPNNQNKFNKDSPRLIIEEPDGPEEIILELLSPRDNKTLEKLEETLSRLEISVSKKLLPVKSRSVSGPMRTNHSIEYQNTKSEANIGSSVFEQNQLEMVLENSSVDNVAGDRKDTSAIQRYKIGYDELPEILSILEEEDVRQSILDNDQNEMSLELEPKSDNKNKLNDNAKSTTSLMWKLIITPHKNS